MHPYRTDDAEIIVVAMGSVLGTLKDAVDARRELGEHVGVLGVTSFRPFPSEAVRDALAGARQVVVIEKAFSVGAGGVLSTDIAIAMHRDETVLRTVVAGLGGRPITRRSLEKVLDDASQDQLVAAHLPRPRSRSRGSRARANAGDPTLGSLGRESVARPRNDVPTRRKHDDPTRPLLPSRQLCRRQPAPRRRRAHRAGPVGSDELHRLGPPRLPGLR